MCGGPAPSPAARAVDVRQRTVEPYQTSPPGDARQRVVGVQAAAQVQALVSEVRGDLKALVAEVKTELRAEIRAEIRAQVRAEVLAEMGELYKVGEVALTRGRA